MIHVSNFASGKIRAESSVSVHEELSFGFKIAELKDQMYRHRDRIDTVDQVAFGWAQSEVEAAVLFRKAWQAVKIIDFLGSQDRQTAGVSGHVR